MPEPGTTALALKALGIGSKFKTGINIGNVLSGLFGGGRQADLSGPAFFNSLTGVPFHIPNKAVESTKIGRNIGSTFQILKNAGIPKKEAEDFIRKILEEEVAKIRKEELAKTPTDRIDIQIADLEQKLFDINSQTNLNPKSKAQLKGSIGQEILTLRNKSLNVGKNPKQVAQDLGKGAERLADAIKKGITQKVTELVPLWNFSAGAAGGVFAPVPSGFFGAGTGTGASDFTAGQASVGKAPKPIVQEQPLPMEEPKPGQPDLQLPKLSEPEQPIERPLEEPKPYVPSPFMLPPEQEEPLPMEPPTEEPKPKVPGLQLPGFVGDGGRVGSRGGGEGEPGGDGRGGRGGRGGRPLRLPRFPIQGRELRFPRIDLQVGDAQYGQAIPVESEVGRFPVETDIVPSGRPSLAQKKIRAGKKLQLFSETPHILS